MWDGFCGEILGRGVFGGGFGDTKNRGVPTSNDGDIGPSAGSGGRPGPSQHSPQTPSTESAQPTETSKPLQVSLEDLYHGAAAKRMKVSRKLLNGTTEEKVNSSRAQSVS